ncbi:uncharacterized protein LOC132557793 [Ylistrum balloti]|uniref:uncharacterized protein LOC132557793 n=1 Tax=Ylistrum balloti TaxID=509963 RepID=UPI0029059341|nr:uncharacterized protein LOC132557793 [Ylistrum balloti]
MEIPSHIVAPDGIELRRSEVDTSQIGAWCVTPIAKGTIFGPFVGEIVNKYKNKNIDYRFAWEVFDLEKNELSHIINATDPMKGNWMRYVNCARFLEEQNIVSVQDNGEVFYKAIQDVDPQKELLTWFQPFKKRRRRRKTATVEGKLPDAAVQVKAKSQPKVKTPSKVKSCAMETEPSSKKLSSKVVKEASVLTEPASEASAMAATELVSMIPTASTGNYIDSPIEILDTKRQRKKKKLFDEEILLTDLVFKKKRRRRSKEEIERDAIEAALNAQSKGKRKRGRKKKSDTIGKEEIPEEFQVNNDEHGVREDSPMKTSPVLENLEEVEGNTVESLEKSWKYPGKHLEYQFSLHSHFGITQNGRRAYRCDVCAGVYKHTFSLKRHYLRNHINCRYLSRADITNCMILIGQQQLAILKSNGKDVLQKIDETMSKTCNENELKLKKECETESQNSNQGETAIDSKEEEMEVSNNSNTTTDSVLQSVTDPSEQNSQSCQDEQSAEQNMQIKIKKENSTEESPDEEMQTTVAQPLPAMVGLYKCNVCYKLFDDVKALKLHTQDHPKVPDEKGFSCDKCHMRFTYKQNLVRHQMVHKGEADRPVKSLSTMPVKTKQKHGEKKVPVVGKPFKCPRCPMKFKYTTNLERHEALHFADRSFICSYCGKGFPSATNMKKHEHIHLGSRVPCKYCTAVFVHVGSLRKHIRLEHPDIHRQRLLKLLEKRGKLGSKAARTLQESYNKEPTSTLQDKQPPSSSQIAQRMKIMKEGKVPVRDESDSKFKFSCLICKKRFSAYVNLCRHRRLAHKDDGKLSRIIPSESTITETSFPSTVKPKRQLSRLRILMGSPKRDEEPIVFETANDPIDDSPEANLNFYANVAANIAENLTSYIDGGEDSIAHFRQHIRIKDYDSVFTTVKDEKSEEQEKTDVKDEFQWEKFNFPRNYNPKVITEDFMDVTELVPLENDRKVEQVTDEASYKNKVPALCTRRRTSREGLSSAENSRDGLETGHFQQKELHQNETKMDIKTEVNDDKKNDENREDKHRNMENKLDVKGDDKYGEMENANKKSDVKEEVTKAVLKLPLKMSSNALKTDLALENHDQNLCDNVKEHSEQRNIEDSIHLSLQHRNSDSLESNSGPSESMSKGDPNSVSSEILSKGEPTSESSKCLSKGEPNSGSSECLSDEEPNSVSSEILSKGEPTSESSKCLSKGEPNSGSSECLSDEEPNSGSSECLSKGEPNSGSSECLSKEEPNSGSSESLSKGEPNFGSSESLSKGEPNFRSLENSSKGESSSKSSEISSKEETMETKENEDISICPGDAASLHDTDSKITVSESTELMKAGSSEKAELVETEDVSEQNVGVESISDNEEPKEHDVPSVNVEKEGANKIATDSKPEKENHQDCLQNDGSCVTVTDVINVEKSANSNGSELTEKDKNDGSINKDTNPGLQISNGADVAELWCHETLSNTENITPDSNIDMNSNNNNTDDLNLCQNDDSNNSGYSSPGVYNPPLSPDSESDLDLDHYGGAVSARQLIQGLNLAKARQNWQENNNIGSKDDRIISAERIYRSLLKLREDPDQSPQRSPLHNFDSIAFGNFGKRAYVCSVCMRHFADNEAVLRHQWKKHPLVACHTLEIEDGHDIEYLYYTQPTNVGILGACGKALEKVMDRNTYTCTRCNGSFKNIDRLHIHIMNCAPKPAVSSETQEKLPRKRRRKFPKKLIGMELETQDAEQQEREKLEELSRNYIAKLKAQKKIFLGCRKRKLIDVPINENSNDTKMKRRRSYEIGYNPGNHVRRREMTELLDTHQCKGCGVKFKSISLLERHVRKCDGKEKFKDLKVMKSTVNESFHKKHKQTCLYCQRGFAYPKTLMNHYRAFCVVKKEKLIKGTLSEAERKTEAEMIVRLKQQDEDRNEAVSVHHMEEIEGHRKGWPKGLKRKSRRKNHCWTYIKKRKSSNDAFENDDDYMSETPSRISSDSPSKSNDSFSSKSESVSSQQMDPMKRLDFSNKANETSLLSEEYTNTSASTDSNEKQQNPVVIKIETFENLDAAVSEDCDEETRKEGESHNNGMCSSQTFKNVEKQSIDNSSVKGGSGTSISHIDGSKVGQENLECKLVKYNVDTVSPGSDQHMLKLKPVVEGILSQNDEKSASTVSQGRDSSLNKPGSKSPKKVKKNKLSPLSMTTLQSSVSSHTASTVSSQQKEGSDLSSVNMVYSQKTALHTTGDSGKPQNNAAVKSPAKKPGKKPAATTQTTKQDLNKQNVKDMSFNEEKGKKGLNKAKGITSGDKMQSTTKRAPVVLNCPDLSKMIGKGDLPKKTSMRKPKKSVSSVEIRTISQQNQSDSSSTLNSEIQQISAVTGTQKLGKVEFAQKINSGSLHIACKTEIHNESKDLSAVSRLKPSLEENPGMSKRKSSELSSTFEQKTTDSQPRMKNDLVNNELSQKSCSPKSLERYDMVQPKVLSKMEKTRKLSEDALTKRDEDVNTCDSKTPKVIVHLGSEKFCVSLPNPAISSVLNSTSKITKIINKTETESVANQDSKETTNLSEEEKKGNNSKTQGSAATAQGHPLKTVPKMSKVLMDCGKISNVRWPVKKPPLDEGGLVKVHCQEAATGTQTGNVLSSCDGGKDLPFGTKIFVDKTPKNICVDTTEKSPKKQQRPTVKPKPKLKQQKSKQQSENISNESMETIKKGPTRTLRVKYDGDFINVEIPDFNTSVGEHSDQTHGETPRNSLVSVSKVQGFTTQKTSISNSVINVPQIQSDAIVKSPRKRRKTSPKINLSPEIKATKCVQDSARLSMSPDKISHDPVSTDKVTKVTRSTDEMPKIMMTHDQMSKDKVETEATSRVKVQGNKLNSIVEDFDSLAPMNNLLQLACIATDVLKGVVASSDEEERTSVSKTSPFHSESVQETLTPNSISPSHLPSKTVSANATPKLMDPSCVNRKMSNIVNKVSNASLSVKPINSKEAPVKLDSHGSKADLTIIPISAKPLKPSPRKKRVTRSPMKLATREELLNKCGLSPHTVMFTNTMLVKGDNSEIATKGDKMKSST